MNLVTITVEIVKHLTMVLCMNIRHIIIILCILTPFVYNRNVECSHTIIINLFPYPDNSDALRLTQKIQQPGKIAKYTLHNTFARGPVVGGIFATYAGYLTTSSPDGIITFPLKHVEPEFELVVTPSIAPVIMLGRTVSHWELIPSLPVQWYHAKRYHDEENDIYYWDINEKNREDFPENNILPLDTIVLFSKPDKIYVAEGVTPTTRNPQLVLPPIYIKRNKFKIQQALLVLDIRNLFSGVDYEYKREPKALVRQVEEMSRH